MYRILFVLFLVAGFSNSTFSAEYELMMMPGKVISGHAKYEAECDKCHVRFSQKSQMDLCLDCHVKIAKDIQDKDRLHALDKRIIDVDCKTCHTDHIGRDADILSFSTDSLNHDDTKFHLKEAHKSVACSGCHKPDKKYREAPSKCFDCHKDDDIHKEKLGKKCQDCHNEKNWTKTKFDHDKTDYKLTGKHKKTQCLLCHPAQKYKKVPKKCVGCHKLNDVHKNKYKDDCKRCHTPETWSVEKYDHKKMTKYELKGKHKNSKCINCHKKDFEKDADEKCYTCHKKEDKHKKQLGKRCEACHVESDWRKTEFKHKTFKKVKCVECHKKDDQHNDMYGEKCDTCHNDKEWRKTKYDHEKEAKFPLKGKHEKVLCESCHKGKRDEKAAKRNCMTCHEIDTPHKGKENRKCGRCHLADGWRETKPFDHDATRFPRIGMHAVTPCENCHLQSEYRGLDRTCKSCHEKDDEHKKTLGPKCGSCHNPNSWVLVLFDHDKASDFKLKGEHKKIECVSCHFTVIEKEIEMSETCYSCHQSDDEHSGSFGFRCEDCHNPKAFNDVTIK